MTNPRAVRTMQFRVTFSGGGVEHVYLFDTDDDHIEDAGGEFELLRSVCEREAEVLTRRVEATRARLTGRPIHSRWHASRRERREHRNTRCVFIIARIEKRDRMGQWQRVKYQPADGQVWP